MSLEPRSLSGALSDLGRQLTVERQRLVAELVQRLAGAQPGGEQHAALAQDCLAALQHHSFADPNPRDVDELLDRLGDRFGEHAQFHKQRALELLRGRLAGMPLESAQYEFRHRLLAFLYAAARSPLAAPYSGGGRLVEALEQRAQAAVVGPPTYLSDASEDSWVDEAGAYSPGSQLSQWSDASDDEQPAGEQQSGGGAAAAGGRGSQQGGEADQAGGEAELEAGSGLQPSSMAALAALAADLGRPLPPELHAPASARRESPYTRTSLSVWLASKASGGQPARVLEPRLCFHEHELVAQVVHMLKGVATPGPAFRLDPVRAAYAPTPGVHLHSSSHGAARALLGRFAEAATAVRRVQAFCAAAAAGGSVAAAAAAASEEAAAEQRRLYALPTVAAFAAAVAEQQQGLQRQVLILEAAAASGALSSLLQLQQRTAGLAQQAALLAALARRCCVWRGSPAETAAGLLSGLYEALQLQLAQARSEGGVLAAMLLRVFTAACRPLLAALHAWLYRGQLDDPAAEFFVQASGADIPTDSPRFWQEAYTLRRASCAAAAAGGSAAGAPAAAPCFLLPLAEGILAAGKAALLLQAYSSWRLAAAAARRAGSLGGGGAAAAAAGSGSPSKRRLSEFGALGFAIAAGQQGPGQQHPYGVPPPALAAAEGLALFVGTGEAPGPEPLPLHQQLERNLEERLQETALAASSGRGGASAGLALPAAAAAAVAEVAGSASPGSTSSSGGGASSGSRACHAEWAAAAACGDHTLLLPPGDLLPPLPAVPASAEELPATAAATIPPPPLAPEPLGADSQAHAAAQAQRSSGGKGASTSGELSMAERMRAAAAARVAQATCAALDQLQQLIIPPAPLEALAAAAGADAAALAATPEAAAAAARQFDGGAWQQWYARVATSLSQRLQVLDSLRGSSGGGAAAASAATSRPIGSFGVPLGLPRYTGASPSEQLWGRGGTPGSGGSGSALLGGGAAPPLRAELAAEAPPLDVLLQDSLLRPVRAQVDAAGGALCTALLRHGLLRQLAALRDTHLLGSPLLEPFVSFLLRRISTAGGMDRMSEFELNASLQDALVAGGQARMLRVSAQLLPAPAGGAAGAPPSAAGVQPRVQQLGRLRLRVEPGWPLSLVVGEGMLTQYNAVLVLLLQLRWVKQSLQAVRYHAWKRGRRAGQGGRARDGLQHQMVHLVDSVLQYVNDRVAAAGAWLEQAVEGCASLDEMHRCRAKYLRAVARYCLLGSDGVARLVHEALLHLLNACLQYCTLHKQVAATAAALRALAEQQQAGGAGEAGAPPPAPAAEGSGDGEAETGAGAGAPADAATAAGLQWAAARRAELQRRGADAARALGALRREYGQRQRLLLRVLSTKAAEAGSHADELRQLLGALDFSRHYERSMG